jgi:hypothetical protein
MNSIVKFVRPVSSLENIPCFSEIFRDNSLFLSVEPRYLAGVIAYINSEYEDAIAFPGVGGGILVECISQEAFSSLLDEIAA